MLCVKKELNILSCITGENDLYFHSLQDSYFNYVIFNSKIFTEGVCIEVKSWLRTLSIIGDASLLGRANIPRNDLLCWDCGLLSSSEQNLIGEYSKSWFAFLQALAWSDTDICSYLCAGCTFQYPVFWSAYWMVEKSCLEKLIWLVSMLRLWHWILLGALRQSIPRSIPSKGCNVWTSAGRNPRGVL